MWRTVIAKMMGVNAWLTPRYSDTPTFLWKAPPTDEYLAPTWLMTGED